MEVEWSTPDKFYKRSEEKNTFPVAGFFLGFQLTALSRLWQIKSAKKGDCDCSTREWRNPRMVANHSSTDLKTAIPDTWMVSMGRTDGYCPISSLLKKPRDRHSEGGCCPRNLSFCWAFA
jgi:hypothetical protein